MKDCKLLMPGIIWKNDGMKGVKENCGKSYRRAENSGFGIVMWTKFYHREWYIPVKEGKYCNLSKLGRKNVFMSHKEIPAYRRLTNTGICCQRIS